MLPRAASHVSRHLAHGLREGGDRPTMMARQNLPLLFDGQQWLQIVSKIRTPNELPHSERVCDPLNGTLCLLRIPQPHHSHNKF